MEEKPSRPWRGTVHRQEAFFGSVPSPCLRAALSSRSEGTLSRPPPVQAASGPSGRFPHRGILALPVQPTSCLLSLKPPQAPPLHSWEASRPPTLHSPSGKITVAHTVSSPSSAESLLCPGFVPLRTLSQLLRGRPEGEHACRDELQLRENQCTEARRWAPDDVMNSQPGG